MSGNYVINIGRQLGSGGKEIGEKLAARLGIDFYDKELINLASEESGLCKEFFEKADEKASQGIIGGLFGMRFPFISEGAMPCTNCLSNDALFKVQVMLSVVWRQRNPVCSSDVVPTIFYGNIPVVQMSLFRLLKKIVSHGYVRCIVLMRRRQKR